MQCSFRPMVQYASGFPKQLKITHKFTQSNWLTYSGPNLNCVWYSYGVNCLYDPVLAVGGTQPMYFLISYQISTTTTP